MTTLYKPVLIESAEQAEALPVGTIAKDGDLSVAVKAEDGHWARTDVADGLPMMTGGSMVGWTALVPIEAEEETREHPTRVEERPESAYLQPVQQVRYKTRWEAA